MVDSGLRRKDEQRELAGFGWLSPPYEAIVGKVVILPLWFDRLTMSG